MHCFSYPYKGFSIYFTSFNRIRPSNGDIAFWIIKGILSGLCYNTIKYTTYCIDIDIGYYDFITFLEVSQLNSKINYWI